MCGHLEYNSLTIVWVQTFSGGVRPASFAKPLDAALNIDRQIFDSTFLEQTDSIERYELPGFDIDLRIRLTDDSPTVRGRVHVQASSYFGVTTSITYRLLITRAGVRDPAPPPYGPFCTSDGPLDSDDLIILAGLPQAIEHWHESQDRDTSIDLPVGHLKVTGLRLSKEGLPQSEPQETDEIADVFNRYGEFFSPTPHAPADAKRRSDSFYVMIDIWEDLQHSSNASFSFSDAPSIIAHIAEQHKSELMGLLTLYPYEWPYRDARLFERVCGSNIAIDTDDLVLASDNVCVVFGTYGLRGGAGAPTDWSSVLADTRLKQHVSWPEYLLILDIVIAKLHTIKATLSRLLRTSDVSRNATSKIEDNSNLAINAISVILRLDALRFSRFQAHKSMYRATEERLSTAKEMRLLRDSLAEFDRFLKTIDSIEQAKRDNRAKALLAYIALAAIVPVVFLDTTVPIVRDLISANLAQAVGRAVLVGVTAGLVILGAVTLVRMVRRNQPRDG